MGWINGEFYFWWLACYRNFSNTSRYLKIAYSLYKNFIQKEANRDCAIRGLLRVEIINICHNAEKEGFLPIWALENLTDMYNTYKALGGNGAITGLYNKTIQLPQRKED